MGGLIEATAIVPLGEGYLVNLDPAWDIWGPAGGYIAAIALRTVRERAVEGHRPVTITGQFVRVARPGALEIQIEPIKEGASALYAVTLAQEGKPIFLAQVWTTARNDPSLPIVPVMPDVPQPDTLRDLDEIAVERGLQQNKFWRNLESKPVHFRLWSDPPAPVTSQYRWLRFREWPTCDDVFYDAMRLALLIDMGIWPGHWHKLAETASYLAPSLDLTAHFHGGEPAGDWLLSDADSDVSGNGLISGRVRVWSEDGRALATGSGHCLVTIPRKKS